MREPEREGVFYRGASGIAGRRVAKSRSRPRRCVGSRVLPQAKALSCAVGVYISCNSLSEGLAFRRGYAVSLALGIRSMFFVHGIASSSISAPAIIFLDAWIFLALWATLVAARRLHAYSRASTVSVLIHAIHGQSQIRFHQLVIAGWPSSHALYPGAADGQDACPDDEPHQCRDVAASAKAAARISPDPPSS